jgi:hypothetical protein
MINKTSTKSFDVVFQTYHGYIHHLQTITTSNLTRSYLSLSPAYKGIIALLRGIIDMFMDITWSICKTRTLRDSQVATLVDLYQHLVTLLFNNMSFNSGFVNEI